ncbi:helix-turn-helix domain-containing protein [Marinilabiliaceae bacterium JC017]|nr:helix-turn-helix domain-containing protein [Marinilabiliaceae bacterium JC017]
MLPTVAFESRLHFKELDVDSIESLIERAGDIFYKPHKSDFYKVIYVRSGSATFYIDFVRYEISSGKILYISKEPVYWFEKIKDLKGTAILFSADLIYQLNNLFMPYLIWDLNGCKWWNSIKTLIELILVEYKSKEPDSIQVQEYLLNSLLMYLKRSQVATDITNQHDYQLFFRFRDFVEKLYKEKKLISDYSALLAISERNLHRITLKFAGKSPGKIIEERVILEAKRLLSYTKLRNKEVSEQLGFNDDSYFIKFFRKHVQMTPKAFQSQLQEVSSNSEEKGYAEYLS